MVDNSDEIKVVEKLEEIKEEQKEIFERNLEIIRDNNYNRNSLVSEASSMKRSDLTTELMTDEQLKEVDDQILNVNIRQQNLKELDLAIQSINNLSEQIHTITKEDGEKVEGLMKKQKQHKQDMDDRIIVEIDRTEEINSRTCKSLVFWAFLLIILAIGVLGVLYMKRR